MPAFAAHIILVQATDRALRSSALQTAPPAALRTAMKPADQNAGSVMNMNHDDLHVYLPPITTGATPSDVASDSADERSIGSTDINCYGTVSEKRLAMDAKPVCEHGWMRRWAVSWQWLIKEAGAFRSPVPCDFS